MGTLAAGYGIVCLAIVLYVARLGQRQRRLAQQYELLRAELQASETRQPMQSRAA